MCFNMRDCTLLMANHPCAFFTLLFCHAWLRMCSDVGLMWKHFLDKMHLRLYLRLRIQDSSSYLARVYPHQFTVRTLQMDMHPQHNELRNIKYTPCSTLIQILGPKVIQILGPKVIQIPDDEGPKLHQQQCFVAFLIAL
jgi:hypothetical protein